MARLGGDEFVVLCPELEDAAALDDIAERLRAGLRVSVRADGGELVVTPSIGIAATRDPGMPGDELLRRADAAMYEAKSAGGDGHVRAPGTGIVLRPRVRLADHRPVGVEAVGDGVTDATWREAARWTREPLGVAARLAPRQLPDVAAADALAGQAARHGVDPGTVTLEVDERSLAAAGAAQHAALRRLAEHGFRVSLGNVGAGQHSLAALAELPVHELKIDASFVAALPHDPARVRLVEAMLLLARAIGATTVADGVETLEQARTLRELGCDHAQGGLFGHPAPAGGTGPHAPGSTR